MRFTFSRSSDRDVRDLMRFSTFILFIWSGCFRFTCFNILLDDVSAAFNNAPSGPHMRQLELEILFSVFSFVFVLNNLFIRYSTCCDNFTESTLTERWYRLFHAKQFQNSHHRKYVDASMRLAFSPHRPSIFVKHFSFPNRSTFDSSFDFPFIVWVFFCCYFWARFVYDTINIRCTRIVDSKYLMNSLFTVRATPESCLQYIRWIS